MTSKDKQGQVAFVTGSSRGIGLAIARALALRGFAVALNAPQDDEALENAAQELRDMGAEVVKTVMDVRDHAAYEGALDAIEAALGPLSTLVNNAGVSVLNRGDMLEVNEESFDRCMDVNAKAVFFLSQAFAKRLIAREQVGEVFCSIVNITSSNARAVALPRSEYAVSKAAAAMVSQALATRLGVEGINVYDVQPGLIATDMTKSVIASYEERAKAGLTVLPRIGQPEDMGEIVGALAAGEMSYVTGQVIAADGGLLIPRF